MSQTSILVQLDPAVQARLAALADDRQQPVSDLAAEVISMYVAPDSWEHKHIRAGMAELEAGQGISNERVMEWLDSWGTENELPAPK
ncbi:MAG TPA: CopG family ribbon-helix-helix protein [Terracidiphilus sp.]|jgi:predicted transcriptional regulator|nr:CopG family ribbon-helix-helix protein [Terracidiphilus sp.]